MNLKQKERVKIRIFYHNLQELPESLFRFIQTNLKTLKSIKLKDFIYQKVLLTITTSSLMERTFITNPLILI